MASASQNLARHVSAPGPGIPSRLARNVRDPSGSGSAGEYGMGVEGVEKGVCGRFVAVQIHFDVTHLESALTLIVENLKNNH